MSVVPPPMSMSDDAELLLVGEQHRLGRGERLEHDVLHGEAGAVDRADDVLHRGDGAGHDVDLDLEAHAGHADRLADAVRVVDRRSVCGSTWMISRSWGRLMARAASTTRSTSAALTSRSLPEIGDDAAAVDAADVAAGDAGVHAGDLDAGHLLGLADRLLDGLDGGVDVDHHAAPQPARGRRAHADDVAGRRPARARR